MKNYKEKRSIIVLGASLAIVTFIAVVSIIYNILGGNYESRLSYNYQSLGEDLFINAEGVGLYTTSCTFSGSLVLEDVINQKVQVNFNGTFERALYIRATAKIAELNAEIMMFGYSNWILNNNIIYLNQPIVTMQSIGLCEYIAIDKNINLESNKNYNIVFVLEVSEDPWVYE